MTDTRTLPHFGQPVVEQGGTITRPWGAWVQRVNASLNTGALGVGELVANMAAVATALGSPDGTVAGIPAQSGYLSASTSLQPQMSVVGYGTLANGLMTLTLANDAPHPGNRTAYGTDSDGAKGFNPIADAFTATPGNVTLTTGADGVTDVDLADLADSGTGTLQAITRDSKGRLSGSRAATTADVAPLVVAAAITDGDTTHAPSGDAMFDALALKAPASALRAIAGISANQVLANATTSKVNLNTESVDSAGCFDPATGRFTPTLAGMYLVIASVSFVVSAGVTTAGERLISYVYKNGASYQNVTAATHGTVTNNIQVIALVAMNGATDYLEMYARRDTTATYDVQASATQFSAVRVSST